MKNKISLRHRSALVLTPSSHNNRDLAMSLNASLMQYGFIVSEDLYKTLVTLPREELVTIYENVVPEIMRLKGADVSYTPMYPNFPAQVMEASYFELFLNAICHYWTDGEWLPKYNKLPRELTFEDTQFKEIGVINEKEFDEIFSQLLSSNDSISEVDKEIVTWFIDNLDSPQFPDMPFKENLCLVAGLLLDRGKDITTLPKTATDVLRIATQLSEGDISLAANTRFKSLKRPVRRMLVNALVSCLATRDDFLRHRNKWVRLFHSLHINELTRSTPLLSCVKSVRSGERVITFNSQVEAALASGDVVQATELLITRPGDFARRIDHILRLNKKANGPVIETFLSVADAVSTRVLLQLLGNLKVRGLNRDKRVVFPKGNIQRATVLREKTGTLPATSIKSLTRGITKVLTNRFSALEPLGKVFIDPELAGCPLPTQQRSASEGLIQVARGTRMPLGDKNTLRFFIYWVGRDIDLSATLHDENFKSLGHVSYTRLKSDKYQSYHSGDIVNAPNGACEFIDITMDGAIEAGVRYVAMNVLVYSGPTFAEHKKVHAGWMTRDKPQSNEIFEPKTVEQRIDLTSESTNCIPAIFDLVEGKAIWTDLTTPRHVAWGGNNVESNRASIQETMEAIVDCDNKTSLYELFEMHATSRGEIVDSKEEADVVFSMSEGIGPSDIITINAEYLTDGVLEVKNKQKQAQI